MVTALAVLSIILRKVWESKWKWLAKIFAFFGVCVGLFGIGTFSQVNGISSAVQNFFDPNKSNCVNIPFLGEYSWAVVISSLILAACVAAILIGGLKRIATVSQIIVPFMAVIYLIFSVALILLNITEIPAAIVTVVKGAFNPSAVTGGVVGTMIVSMQKGVARGIFSNEAGLGSAPIAAAAAQTKEPVRQGLVSMTGTFIDTIVICTMTGLFHRSDRCMAGRRSGRCSGNYLCIPARTSDPWTGFCICINDLSGILCIYYDSWRDYYMKDVWNI